MCGAAALQCRLSGVRLSSKCVDGKTILGRGKYGVNGMRRTSIPVCPEAGRKLSGTVLGLGVSVASTMVPGIYVSQIKCIPPWWASMSLWLVLGVNHITSHCVRSNVVFESLFVKKFVWITFPVQYLSVSKVFQSGNTVLLKQYNVSSMIHSCMVGLIELLESVISCCKLSRNRDKGTQTRRSIRFPQCTG